MHRAKYSAEKQLLGVRDVEGFDIIDVITMTTCNGNSFYPSNHEYSTAAVILRQFGLDCSPGLYGPQIINNNEVPSVIVRCMILLEGVISAIFRKAYGKIVR
jgi:hypothetical protein